MDRWDARERLADEIHDATLERLKSMLKMLNELIAEFDTHIDNMRKKYND